MSKKQRIEIQNDTINYVNKNKAKFKSKIIKYLDYSPLILKTPSFITNIQVTPNDTLEAAIELEKKVSPLKVGFLIFANSTNQGGRYKEGTPAQEESICRRTNLVQCFDQMKYPIPEFGLFYIKDISIIRDTEKNNYKMFDKMYTMDCILSAAYQSPPLNINNNIENEYRLKTKIKIKSILNRFLENNVYNIVLGAFGCGAFDNPVSDISNIFDEILKETTYKNKFQNIIFAVLKDMGGENYKTFVEKFQQN